MSFPYADAGGTWRLSASRLHATVVRALALAESNGHADISRCVSDADVRNLLGVRVSRTGDGSTLEGQGQEQQEQIHGHTESSRGLIAQEFAGLGSVVTTAQNAERSPLSFASVDEMDAWTLQNEIDAALRPLMPDDVCNALDIATEASQLPSSTELAASSEEVLLNSLSIACWFITPDGSEPLLHFAQLAAALQPPVCTESWAERRYFYRCRDCSLSTAGSICTACFERGNHEGHDFVFECSSFGGCCDCGNAQVWKSSGFCSVHRGDVSDKASERALSAIENLTLRIVTLGVIDFFSRVLEGAHLLLIHEIQSVYMEQEVEGGVIGRSQLSEAPSVVDNVFDVLASGDEHEQDGTEAEEVVEEAAEEEEVREERGDEHGEEEHDGEGEEEYDDTSSGHDANFHSDGTSDVEHSGSSASGEWRQDADETSGDIGVLARAPGHFLDNTTSFSRLVDAILSFFRFIGSHAEVLMHAVRESSLVPASACGTSAVLASTPDSSRSFADSLVDNDEKRWHPTRADVMLDACICVSSVRRQYEATQTHMLFLFLDILLDGDSKRRFLPSYIRSYSRLVDLMVDHDGEVNILYKLSPQMLCITSLVAGSVTVRTALVNACIAATSRMMGTFIQTYHVDENISLQHIDCGSRFVVKRWYYAFTNDLNMLCSVPVTAYDVTVTNPILLVRFVRGILIPCHFMNAAVRQVHRHLEFDTSSWRGSYALEWEVSRTFAALADGTIKYLRQMIGSEHLSPIMETLGFLKPMVAFLVDQIMGLRTTQWLAEESLVHKRVSTGLPVSLHLPVHRLLARQLCSLVNTFLRQNSTVSALDLDFCDIADIRPASADYIVTHPLLCFVVCGQQRAGMWTRNGNGFAMQCAFYAGNFYRDMTQNDLFLLQLCISMKRGVLPFWEMCSKWFEVDCLGWSALSSGGPPVMTALSLWNVTNMLRLWRELQVETQRCGMAVETRVRRELIHHLAARGEQGLAFSEVESLIDEELHDYLHMTGFGVRGSTAVNLRQQVSLVLDDVAESRIGKDGNETRYILRSESWIDVDIFYRFPSDREANFVRNEVDNRAREFVRIVHTYETCPQRQQQNVLLADVCVPTLRLREALHLEQFHVAMLTCLDAVDLHETGQLQKGGMDEELHAPAESLILIICSLIHLVLDNINQARVGEESTMLEFFPSVSFLEKVQFSPLASARFSGKSIVELLCSLLQRDADRAGYISPLLSRICCDARIRQIVRSQLPSLVCSCGGSSVGATAALNNQVDQRRQAMRLRQERILQQMRQSQTSFLESASPLAVAERAPAVDETQTVFATEPDLNVNDVCVLCHRSETNFIDVSVNDTLGMACMFLSTCRGSHDKQAPKLPAYCKWWGRRASSPSPTENCDTDQVGGLAMLTSSETADSGVLEVFHVPELERGEDGAYARVRVSTCGHVIHNSCYETFQRQQLRDFSPEQLRYDRECPDASIGEYRCPQCRRLCNALLPRFEVGSVDSRNSLVLQSPSRTHSHLFEFSEVRTMVNSVINGDTSAFFVFREQVDVQEPKFACLGHSARRLFEIAQNVHRNEFADEAAAIADTGTNVSVNDFEAAHWAESYPLPVLTFACATNAHAVECVSRHQQSTSTSYFHGDFAREGHVLRSLAAGCALAALKASRSADDSSDAALSTFRHTFGMALDVSRWSAFCEVLSSDLTTKFAQCVLPLPPADDLPARYAFLDLTLGMFYGLVIVQSTIYSVNTTLSASTSPASALVRACSDLSRYLDTASETCLPFVRNVGLILGAISSSIGGEGLRLPSLDLQAELQHLHLPSISEIFADLKPSMQPRRTLCSQVTFAFVSHVLALAHDAMHVPDPSNINFPPQLAVAQRNNDAFRVINLPDTFQELLISVSRIGCARCGQCPAEMAICLFCGRLLCVANRCCSWATGDILSTDHPRRIFEVYSHFSQSRCAGSCRGSGGLFLLLRTARALVLWERKYAVWQSLYLDRHGEEDVGLRRGKPLYLNQGRLAQLLDIWVMQRFDAEPSIARNMLRDSYLL